MTLLLAQGAPSQTSTASKTPPTTNQDTVNGSASETVILPKNPIKAWELLQSVTGLGDDTLRPWFIHATYKTYDAYGKPKGEGAFEYVWAGPDSWRETFTERGTSWTRWRTKYGSYAPPSQQLLLGYPASLILNQIRDPIQIRSISNKREPGRLKNEKIGAVETSCLQEFSLLVPRSGGHEDRVRIPDRFCTVLGKPILLLSRQTYAVAYDKASFFQHHFIAQEIHVQDEQEVVLDINADVPRTPEPQEMLSLEPPSDAVLQGKYSSDGYLYSEPEKTHLLQRGAPFYPQELKQRRIEGTVRLSAVVTKNGRLRILEVLHSPNPDLTAAAEEAARQWIYSPYLENGSPIEVPIVVALTYVLGR